MTNANRGEAMDRKRLLIVDDALIIRKRIRQIAESSGWEVAAEAANGVEALTLFAECKPDMVTLDIVMPELDGVETLKQIMAQSPQARVVMVSAVNQKDKLVECIQAGAVDFIVKPFERDSLQSFFTKYLKTD